MTAISIFFALLFYVSALVFIVGVGRKIYQYANTPNPLKIPTTPAPTTKGGVVLRMISEVVFFQSLFKSNKWIWIFGWMFHVALALVLARHLRYFTEPVWWWVELIQPFGKYAAYAMLVGLAGLWARRILVDRVRYISAPSDHLMLLLIFSIAASGTLIKFVWHTDVVAVKAFFLGLLYFNWQPLPTGHSGDSLLVVHLLLVAALLLVFSFSKLLHAPGVFFSPTRNQVDNPREKRLVADWAVKLETKNSSS